MKRCLLFFERENISNFYPISLSHTTAELRCGILNLGEKWRYRLKPEGVCYLARPELAAHITANCGIDSNLLEANLFDQFVFIDPLYLPDDEITAHLVEEASTAALFVDGEPAVIVTDKRDELISLLTKKLAAKERPDFARLIGDAARQLPRNDAKLEHLDYLWDLVHANGRQIESDFQLLSGELNFSGMHHVSDIDSAVSLYNADDIYVDHDSQIDAQVVIDARGGPVYIGKETVIAPHTRIEGPAFVGDNCHLVGGKIREGCSFGPHCRIGGEVEESIFQAYSNKYHDGFLGHAYIGEWVNLGALTTNSDLKNNYGNIKVELPGGLIDTRLNKVGSFIGDHTKTGIGTLLNTGMVIGFASNVFGGGMIKRKSLPSFIWGSTDGLVDYNVEKAIATARTVMSRRDRELSPATEQLFRDIFAQTSTARLAVTGK